MEDSLVSEVVARYIHYIITGGTTERKKWSSFSVSQGSLSKQSPSSSGVALNLPVPNANSNVP